jgi:17beta-estradiol 17-dehydrogenase / very-long-chain 3-oxoacyl-CoA reductase
MTLTAHNLVTAIGAATLLTAAYKLGSLAYVYTRPSSLPRYLKTSDGSPAWAFITGASDGVGKAFAGDLASRGFNIVLHGRNPTKLEAVKADLETRYPSREVRIVIADASKLSEIDFPAIAQSVADIKLKVLVNNAGTTMPRGHEFDALEAYTAKELEANMTVNGTFHVVLTGALMPNLAANEPSLILNIGTIADIGLPLFSGYGPAKAGLRAFTLQHSIEQQYLKRDIEVIHFRILQVTDTGTIVVPKSFLVPDGPTWVRSALARVGCGRQDLFPYAVHALQAMMLEDTPGFISRSIRFSATDSNIKGDPTGSKAEAAAMRKEL